MRAPLGRAGDGKQKRVEVGNVSAAAGLSCEACTNLSSHMGDFTVLMPMDMDVRSNWEVMTRLVPKTAGATSAHQSKLDGGVKHLNISGVPPSDYYPQTLHIDLRGAAVAWKKTYECLLAEGVEPDVKKICAMRICASKQRSGRTDWDSESTHTPHPDYGVSRQGTPRTRQGAAPRCEHD